MTSSRYFTRQFKLNNDKILIRKLKRESPLGKSKTTPALNSKLTNHRVIVRITAVCPLFHLQITFIVSLNARREFPVLQLQYFLSFKYIQV